MSLSLTGNPGFDLAVLFLLLRQIRQTGLGLSVAGSPPCDLNPVIFSARYPFVSSSVKWG